MNLLQSFIFYSFFVTKVFTICDQFYRHHVSYQMTFSGFSLPFLTQILRPPTTHWELFSAFAPIVHANRFAWATRSPMTASSNWHNLKEITESRGPNYTGLWSTAYATKFRVCLSSLWLLKRTPNEFRTCVFTSPNLEKTDHPRAVQNIRGGETRGSTYIG